MPRYKLSGAAVPAAVAVFPFVAAAIRACTTSRAIWFWGDQALIDIEARNSLLGRNLLGVYDRYGWHHLGPMWLLVLGIFRWLGGGSAEAVVVGSYVVQVVAAAAIVVVANRLRPGLTGWFAALMVLGFEWSFGLERLGTVWAPYSIALPAALLVLLVADVANSPSPWAPTVAAAVCATFLCQTDISTAVLVTALVVAAPVLRLAVRVRFRGQTAGDPAAGDPAAGRRWFIEEGWGWSAGRCALGATVLGAVVVLLWLPPAVQQLTSSPGNVVQLLRFLSSHPGDHGWRAALRAMSTIVGSFPFRTGEPVAKLDADPTWLVARSVSRHPWYLAYILVTGVAGARALTHRQRAAFALVATSCIALLVAGLSVQLVYGPLYPYLVIWTGALVVPAWISWWLAFAPVPASGPRQSAVSRLVAPAHGVRLAVPVASLGAAVVLSASVVASSVPMSGVPSILAQRSWAAVASAASGPKVQTIYVDIVNPDAMPEAAAIADQAVRRDRRVELNKAALYFLDPSFDHRTPAQLTVVVCCGSGDPGKPPAGMVFRRRVGGQDIYVSGGNHYGAARRPAAVLGVRGGGTGGDRLGGRKVGPEHRRRRGRNEAFEALRATPRRRLPATDLQSAESSQQQRLQAGAARSIGTT